MFMSEVVRTSLRESHFLFRSLFLERNNLLPIMSSRSAGRQVSSDIFSPAEATDSPLHVSQDQINWIPLRLLHPQLSRRVQQQSC